MNKLQIPEEVKDFQRAVIISNYLHDALAKMFVCPEIKERLANTILQFSKNEQGEYLSRYERIPKWGDHPCKNEQHNKSLFCEILGEYRLGEEYYEVVQNLGDALDNAKVTIEDQPAIVTFNKFYDELSKIIVSPNIGQHFFEDNINHNPIRVLHEVYREECDRISRCFNNLIDTFSMLASEDISDLFDPEISEMLERDVFDKEVDLGDNEMFDMFIDELESELGMK